MKISKYWLMVVISACVQTAVAEDLITVYRQALEADPQLKSAEVKVEIGSAQKGQAFGQMLPQVNASGNWSANKYTQRGQRGYTSNYNGTRYYVSLNQTLVDFAKFWEWRRASKVEDQYAAEAIEAHNQLMFDVVDRYFSVLEADDQVNFAKTEKQAAEKQLEQIKKQYAKQVVKVTDLYAMEARLDQIIAAEILAESRRVTAQEKLRELTGATLPATLNKLREGVDYQEIQGDLQQWVEMAQSQNPAVSAKQIAIQAAENNVATQKSKHLPVLDFQLNFYDTNTGYQSQQLISDTQTEVAAINLNVPIFSGGTTTHQVYEAQHRLQLSKNDNEAYMRAITKETSDAFLSSNANARRIRAAQKALESTKKSREAMERGYHYGVVTISDVIKAQQDEFSAENDFAQAKYEYIKNRIRFMHAIGSISEENLEEVNGWLEAINH
ncbi:TolC family outer membrane protein [Candidatus Methylobacter oryzae]|uniref:TolC family outer membrane protein n=1 Tax=Candidatus Methylobacter oryzae TaxID=2497749 RepID=A0ABY3C7Y8_9GAMM|nr:TolC family outer membrane protein [Candidatus Methylobacter oryzae]TRW92201.1 TolC family outer membrane protein [Candidatus Methylobacter oryzae]